MARKSSFVALLRLLAVFMMAGGLACPASARAGTPVFEKGAVPFGLVRPLYPVKSDEAVNPSALASLTPEAGGEAEGPPVPASHAGKEKLPKEAAEVIDDKKDEGDEEKNLPATGVILGPFLLTPRMSAAYVTEDNVYAAEHDRRHATYDVLNPGFKLELLNGLHQMTLDVDYAYNHYREINHESNHVFRAGLSGSVQATQELKIPYAFSNEITHESRQDDLLRQLPEKPLTLHTLSAQMGVDVKPGAFGVRILGGYADAQYNDGLSQAGAHIVRSDADHRTVRGDVVASYDLEDGQSASLSGRADKADYSRLSYQDGAFSGPRRNSNLYQLLAGWKGAFMGVIHADVHLGWATRHYNDSRINDVNMAIGLADLKWQVTPRTTLDFTVARDHFEDAEIIQPILSTRAGVSLDHNFNEDVSAGIGGRYETRDFSGLARTDEIWGAKTFVNYALDPRLSAGLEYDFTTRSSTVSGFNFRDQAIMARLNGRL